MRTITVDPHQPDIEALRPAADALLAGGLVAFPTETVYGLGALALDAKAVGRIFDAKGRPADDPLIVHVRPHWDLLGVYEAVDDSMRRLIDEYWPGPLTIVAEKAEAVPDVVTSGRTTVAVRAPSHPVAQAILDLVGQPIAAPSANPFSYVSPTTASHVATDLGDVIDVLVDGGPTPVGIESTIVRVHVGRVTVLRPGSVVVPGAEIDTSASPTSSPGRLDVHYSPTTPTRALAARTVLSAQGEGVLIAYDDSAPAPGGWRRVSLGDRHDVNSIAHNLYRTLREVDGAAPSQIVIEFTGVPGVGEAVDDRIRRAAGGQMAI